MAYALHSDLRDRLGPDWIAALADEDGDGAGDDSILDAAIGDASAEIDATLSGRYATPVDPAPEILKRLCVDLAVQFLFLRRREATAPEYLQRAGEARAALRAWGEGEAELEGAEPLLKRMKCDSTTRDQEKHFGRDELDSF
jgi:phage gp36-like protein